MGRLADTQAIAFMLRRPTATIRSWAHRNLLTRHGTGPRNTALYDVDEVLQLVNAIQQIAQIRELHHPRWHDDKRKLWLECPGCDMGPHAEGPADWPCRTAEIVYTAAEITAAQQAG